MVSAEDGSPGPASDRWKLEPSPTGPSFEKVPVGATLATVTTNVFVPLAPSLSVTLTVTV